MTARRMWITLSLTAWVAIAAVVLAQHTIDVARFLFLGPAVTFQAGRGPDGIVISPDGRTLYAADDGYWTGSSSVNGHAVTPISLTTRQAGQPIDVGPDPASLAITPDGRRLFVLPNNTDHPVIRPVDLTTGRVGSPLRFPGGATGMVMAPDGRTLYVDAGTNTALIVPVDVATGREQPAIRIPGDAYAMVITPDGKTLYTASGAAVPGYGPDEVIPVDLASGHAGTPILVPNEPVGIAITPNGHTLYVIGNDNDYDVTGPHSLTAIDTSTGKPAKPLSLGPNPQTLAISPDDGTVYIGNDNHTITPVSTATGKPGPSIRTAPWFPPGDESLYPISMAIAPDGRTLYAVDNGKIAAIPIGT